MKATLGYGASTCSYTDWLDADLIVLFGSNVANNQPVTTKYLHDAKQRGAQIAVVNPYREPGLTRYWVPVDRQRARSFGTRSPTTGSTSTPAATSRSSSACCERSSSPAASTTPSSTRTRPASRRRRRRAAGDDWDAIERESGAPRDRHRGVRAAADRSAERGLRLVDGPDAARARRGHHQGARQRRPRARPAGRPEPRAWCRSAAIRACRAAPRSAACPASMPRRARPLGRGLGLRPADARRAGRPPEMVDRARRRRRRPVLDRRRQLPRDAAGRGATPRRALARPRLRIHQDIVLSSSMLVEATATCCCCRRRRATNRRAAGPRRPPSGASSSRPRFRAAASDRRGRSGGCSARRWRARFPERAPRRARRMPRPSGTRSRAPCRSTPASSGFAQGRPVQWGGRRLYADGRFATADGKAHFAPVAARGRARPGAEALLRLDAARQAVQLDGAARRRSAHRRRARRHPHQRGRLARLGWHDGDAGRAPRPPPAAFRGRLRAAPIKPGNLEVHWPEGNVLLAAARRSIRESLEPDYNAVVTIEAAGA